MADYNSINTAKADSFIPEIWLNESITALRSYLNLAKTVRRDMDSAVARYGDTIHIPKTGALTVNAKVTNENVTRQAPADDEVSVVLDQHNEVTFMVEDPARAMANQSLRQLYINDAVIALAEELEGDLAAEYEQADDDVDFDTSTDATKIAAMLSARKFFVDAKAPKMAKRFLYASPSLVNELLEIDKFTKANEYGSRTPLVEGALGDIFGINVFESQLVISSGSPTPAEHNLCYTSDAIALVMRSLPTDGDGQGASQTVVTDPESGISMRLTSSYDANALGLQITLDMLYGIETVRPEFLLDVQL
jgi:N4-gp56 family major capsid protein